MEKQERDALLKELGNRIKKCREAKKLLSDDVAHAAHMSRSYYSGVETGKRNVSSLNLIKIAIAIDVELAELFPTIAKLEKLQSEATKVDK